MLGAWIVFKGGEGSKLSRVEGPIRRFDTSMHQGSRQNLTQKQKSSIALTQASGQTLKDWVSQGTQSLLTQQKSLDKSRHSGIWCGWQDSNPRPLGS